MGLEKVVQEIEARARKHSDEIVKNAEHEAHLILNEARERAAKAERETIAAVKKDFEQRRAHETAKAEIEAKKLVLNAQKETLFAVQEKAKLRLEALSDDVNRKILDSLLQDAEKDLQKGHIYCLEKDKEFISAFKAFSYKGTSKGGGILVENLEQTVRLDLRYPTLLEGVWEKNISEIAKVLFGA
ncbi:MAG: hypothetical protein HZB68_04990 [Candidatus Aenigmarchaeota archaeon]|nr:hypothetical protein [Candidatus Aenigmarchaeota archaeon]